MPDVYTVDTNSVRDILVVREPKELEGYYAEPVPTLEATGENARWIKHLNKWIAKLPFEENGRVPKEHQMRHSSIGLCRKNNFLAHSMGVGKTLQSLLILIGWFGEELFASRVKPGKIHIIAPRHVLRQVWIREMARIGLDKFAEVIESESQLLNSKAPIFIYNFDFPKLQSDKGRALRKAGQGIRMKANGRTYFVGHPIAKVIAKHRPPSFLIVDEIHKIKKDTERTRALNIVRHKAKRVLGLTGTPMDGWVEHSATIFGFIYGEESVAYPYTNEHFAKKFTRTKIVNTDIATGQEAVGKERPFPGINHMQIPSFIKTTRHLMHRLNITDPEVKANVVYPDVKNHNIVIDMDPEHAAFYGALHKHGVDKAAEEIQAKQSAVKLRHNMLKLMNDLRMASKVPQVLGYTGGTTNLIKAVVAIVRRHKQEGRKGLIGTTFIQESRLIYEALLAEGIKGVRIHAGDPEAGTRTMSNDVREELVERFQEDPDCWFLISNKELVAEGLNLAETASYTVSCSHGWRSNVESQWLSRVVRPGQVWDAGVDAYTLTNRGTIDRYIYQLLEAKIAATASMIDLDFGGACGGEDLATGAEINLVQLAQLLREGDSISE